MSKFTEWSLRMMRDLMAEPQFSFGLYDAAAIVGNAGHESGGFESLQELRPTVRGSRGGYGLFQWTGPRRKAYEAWCKRKKLRGDSYEANYSFLIRELLGPESRAVAAVKRPTSLSGKVKAFEASYERAGVKHYASRIKWAQRALDAYNAKAPSRPKGPTERTEIALTPGIIKLQQKRLRDLGYHKVGLVDGELSPSTEGAIRAFQKFEGLPETGQFDAATLARLETAGSAPISPERANRTLDDLRKGNAQVVIQNDKVKTTSIWQGIAGFFVMIFSAVSNFFGDAWEQIGPVREVISDIPGWVWGAAAVGVSVYLWRRANSAQLWRLDDERTGRHNGVVIEPYSTVEPQRTTTGDVEWQSSSPSSETPSSPVSFLSRLRGSPAAPGQR